MRRFVIAAVLLLFASPASADSMWKLQILSDEALTDSTINDDIPRVVTLYVVESGSFTGATGARFSIKPSAGFTGVWLGDASQFATFGSSPTDIGIGYGACIPPPILVLMMTYQLFGTSTPCSELRVAPIDGSMWVVAPDVNCSFSEGIITDLGRLQVNCPTATEPTTWGKVKSLYRN
jgi:hypothetical protein